MTEAIPDEFLDAIDLTWEQPAGMDFTSIPIYSERTNYRYSFACETYPHSTISLAI